MAFGQLPVPVEPEDLLMAQTMPGAPPSQPQQPSQPAQPQLVPMQVGGTTAFVNPADPNVVSRTEKDPTWSATKTPETAKMVEAQATAAETRAMAEDAAKKQAVAKVQEETFRAEAADRENEILRQQIAEREATLKDQDARVSASLTELRQRQAEQANMKPQTYVENMGTLRHALSAIGVALGAYAATKGGGPNTAFEIFKAGEQAHREKQKALIDQKAAQIEQATGNVRAAMDFKNKALAAVDEKYLLKNKFMQNMIEAKIKRIPTAAASGQAELAKLRKDYDATEMDVAQKLAGTRTDQGPEKSTTEVEGKANAQNQHAPMNVIDSYASMRNRERDMRAGGDAIANDQAFEEWRKAYRDQLKIEIQNRGGFKGITNMGQVLGAVEMNLADRLKTPQARAVNKAMIPIIATQARKLDEVGAMSDMTIQKAEDSLGLASTTSKEMAGLAYQMADDAKAKYSLVEKQYPSLSSQQPSQESPPRPAPTGQTPAQKKYTADTTRQIEQDKRDFAQIRRDIAAADKLLKSKDLDQNEREALEWARKNPSDPRAVEARRRVLQKKGGK